MVLNLGPVLITETASKTCKIGNKFHHSLVGVHGKQCFNIIVMDHQSFHPLKANDRRKLFTSFPKSHWRFLFRRSYSVHFYGQITGQYKTGNGANTAYDYLGPKLCPQTYSLRNNMDDTS